MKLNALMKEKNLTDNPKPGLLKKKFGVKPSKSTEVSSKSNLFKKLTGKV